MLNQAAKKLVGLNARVASILVSASISLEAQSTPLPLNKISPNQNAAARGAQSISSNASGPHSPLTEQLVIRRPAIEADLSAVISHELPSQRNPLPGAQLPALSGLGEKVEITPETKFRDYVHVIAPAAYFSTFFSIVLSTLLARGLFNLGESSRRSTWELRDLSKGLKEAPTVKNLLVSESFDGHTLPGAFAALNSFLSLYLRVLTVSGSSIAGGHLLSMALGIPPVALIPTCAIPMIFAPFLDTRLWSRISSLLTGLPRIECSSSEAQSATARCGSACLWLISSLVTIAGLNYSLPQAACFYLASTAAMPLLRLALIHVRRFEVQAAENARGDEE